MSQSHIIEVERPASGGAVGHLSDGRVVFVRHAIAGERVRVILSHETTKVTRGDAVEILEPSPQRVTPPCPYAGPGQCGGCDFQHVSVQAQLSWKAAIVANQLRRITKISSDVSVTSFGEARGSRTRLRCGVDENGRLGLRSTRSHQIVSVEDCWLGDERFRAAFAVQWRGAREVELRAIGDGEPFAVVHRESSRGSVVEVTSLSGRILDPWSPSRVSVSGQFFQVSPQSFWQSHREAPAALSSRVLTRLGAVTGDRVVDLYSGVGLFAVPLARQVGPHGHVTAVESSAIAVRDARENAGDLRQLRVREWSVTSRSINDAVQFDDLVVLDPPRTGLARGVAEALIRRQPRRIVYVSCDAATFARDLSILMVGGYGLSDVEVLDLFPMTEHVEIVAVLDKE